MAEETTEKVVEVVPDPAVEAAPVERAVASVATEPEKKSPIQKIGSIILGFVGEIAGLISLYASTLFFGEGGIFVEGSDVVSLYQAYGGDAYTGMQNAAADAANASADTADAVAEGFMDLSSMLGDAFGYLFLIIGVALIAYFGIKILRAFMNEK